MAASKAKAPPDLSQRPAAPPRTESHLRFKSPLQRSDSTKVGAATPSTLPPAPFENEAAVAALEWWLDAHMSLASDLAWLEQLVDPEVGLHADTVRRLALQTESVRDALYELYCDAADERLAPLMGPAAVLEAHVRGAYDWCTRVVGLLGTIVNGLRAPAGPDWPAVKAEFREVSKRYPPLLPGLHDAVRELPIDFTSPIEPLRHVPVHVETLFATAEDLQDALTTRFA